MSCYPCVVAHTSDDGTRAAIEWCLERAGEEHSLTLWLPSKEHLDDHPAIERTGRSAGVNVVTPKDGRYCANGPVLAYAITHENLADVVSGSGITCLAVVTNYLFDTWIRETDSKVLVAPPEGGRREDGGDAWDRYPILSLHAADELRAMSRRIDLDHVLNDRDKHLIKATIKSLIQHQEGLTSLTVMEWAAANNWRGRNFKALGNLVKTIESGL